MIWDMETRMRDEEKHMRGRSDYGSGPVRRGGAWNAK